MAATRVFEDSADSLTLLSSDIGMNCIRYFADEIFIEGIRASNKLRPRIHEHDARFPASHAFGARTKSVLSVDFVNALFANFMQKIRRLSTRISTSS